MAYCSQKKIQAGCYHKGYTTSRFIFVYMISLGQPRRCTKYLFIRQIENYAIIANAESVAAKLRVCQPFGVQEKIFFKTKQGSANTFFDADIEPFNILDGFPRTYQPVTQWLDNQIILFTPSPLYG